MGLLLLGVVPHCFDRVKDTTGEGDESVLSYGRPPSTVTRGPGEGGDDMGRKKEGQRRV